MTQADILPGSAADAAAQADAAVKTARPARERLENAQQAQANQAAEQAAAAKRDATTKPTVGRIVNYWAPDRQARAALVVYVHPGEEEAPAGATPDIPPELRVNLRVYAYDEADNQLRRQSALKPIDTCTYLGLSVPIADPKNPYEAHRWSWPERA